jgi:hypothetical protein
MKCSIDCEAADAAIEDANGKVSIQEVSIKELSYTATESGDDVVSGEFIFDR